MILNEDYFKDLEITDKDIIDDVEEPKHDLTVEELHKLPEQYNNLIRFRIEVDDDKDTTFIQTSLIPRLFKRLDTIFELYGIEHYEYVLVSRYYVCYCETVVKFGNHQLFCEEYEKYKFINGKYEYFFIHVYVNYPEFTYKRAFRFLYTVLNLYRDCKQTNQMIFEPLTDDYVIELEFGTEYNLIEFYYYNRKIDARGNVINLGNELTEEDKREFYYSVFYHFSKQGVSAPFKLIDKDVPIKPIILK